MEDVEMQKQPTPKSGPILSKEVEMMEGNPEEIAERLKNEGNDAFKTNNFQLAITKYGQSLGMCKVFWSFNIDYIELVKSEAVYTNRAFSYIKLRK